MSDGGDFDLNSLNDEELVEQMHDDLYDGLGEEIVEGVNILLKRNWTPYDILTKALVEANRAVFRIDSTVGQGTLVSIAFPVTRVLAS